MESSSYNWRGCRDRITHLFTAYCPQTLHLIRRWYPPVLECELHIAGTYASRFRRTASSRARAAADFARIDRRQLKSERPALQGTRVRRHLALADRNLP